MSLSSDGKRIAWMLKHTITPSSIQMLLHRFLPKFSSPSIDRVEVWISDLEGHGMQKIGSMDTVTLDPIGGIQWLPGGRQLGFVYKQKLYTIPVPL
jgi:hypothetical protein